MKTNVLLNVLMIFLLSAQAHARKGKVELPEDAFRVGSIILDTGTTGVSSDGCPVLIDKWVQEVGLYLQNEVATDVDGGLDYQCSTVFSVYHGVKTKYKGRTTRYIFGEPISVSSGSDPRQMYVEFYCKPRSYADKIVLSNLRNCEANPVEECFHQETIDRLSNIRTTIYREVNRPKKCSSNSR